MAEEKDKGYRLLFSHPTMVEHLIRSFVGGPWLERLDFKTLEKVSERDLSPELARREKDLLWRLRYRSDDLELWFYVFFHFEFQSDPEPFMALRAALYKLLFYEDLRRQGKLLPGDKLPLVLSLVVYNGKSPWLAPVQLEDLIASLPGFKAEELPQGFSVLGYQLIEERAYRRDELEGEPNPVKALFLLEQSRGPQELGHALEQLAASRAQLDPSLLEAFSVYVRSVLVPAVAPGQKLPELEALMESTTMLETTVIEWRDSWLAEGRQEGRQEGGCELLLRQLSRKFGTLPSHVQQQVKSAASSQLLGWGDRVLTAHTLDEVFAP